MEKPIVTGAFLPLRLLHCRIERCGTARGLRLWWGLRDRLPGRSTPAIRGVRVPGYAHPVWLRPGTSDVAVLEQIFLRGGLDWVVKDQCLFCYRDPVSMASTGYRDQAISR